MYFNSTCTRKKIPYLLLDETILYIIKYLDVGELYKLSLVCKKLKEIVYNSHYFNTQKNWFHVRYKHRSFQDYGNNTISCLQFNAQKIVSASDDWCIKVYNTSNGEIIHQLEGHEGDVNALQYINTVLASGSADNTVRIWDLKEGTCTHVFSSHTKAITCLQIITPENIILTGSKDYTLKSWNLPNFKSDHSYYFTKSLSDNNKQYLLHTFHGHTDSVNALASSGKTLISGSDDGTIRIWNITTGECIWCLQHLQKVCSVVLDARRKRCISRSADGIVKIWNIEDGTKLRRLNLSSDRMHSNIFIIIKEIFIYIYLT